MSTTEDVVRAAPERCRRVAKGVDELMPRVGPILASPPADLRALSVDDRTAAIAFLKRFEQLQDLLGRLGRAICAWELLDPREMTLRDLANMLEKFAVLSDAEEWMAAARLRNRLVHEYPVHEAEQIARLVETGSLMPSLKNWLAAMTSYLSKRSFPL